MTLPSGPHAPGPEARDGLRRAGIVAWSILGILALAGVVGWLMYLVRAVFPPLVLALAVIFLLNPLVTFLERRGVSRTLGTVAIYVVFLSLVFVAALLLAPALGRQVRGLVEDLPEIRDRATSFAEAVAGRFGVSLDEENLREIVGRFQEQLFTGVRRITEFTFGAFHVLLVLVLAPVFALYLLIDLPKLQGAFVRNLPPQYRDEWLVLLERCGQAVGGFFRGQLLVAAIVGFLSAVGLALAGIRFSLPIGLLAGFFNIIPFVGPFVGGTIAVIVGAITGGATKALLAGAVMLAVQQIDNHFISPNIMGRAVRLHPVTIMLALLAGGTLAGLWGMLLAVPGAAVGKILIMHVYSRHILEPGAEAETSSAGAIGASAPSPASDPEEVTRATGAAPDGPGREPGAE